MSYQVMLEHSEFYSSLNSSSIPYVLPQVMLEHSEFYSNINFYNLVFKSTTPDFTDATDLRQTRVENKKEDKITLFKQLTIGNMLGRVRRFSNSPLPLHARVKKVKGAVTFQSPRTDAGALKVLRRVLRYEHTWDAGFGWWAAGGPALSVEAAWCCEEEQFSDRQDH